MNDSSSTPPSDQAAGNADASGDLAPRSRGDRIHAAVDTLGPPSTDPLRARILTALTAGYSDCRRQALAARDAGERLTARVMPVIDDKTPGAAVPTRSPSTRIPRQTARDEALRAMRVATVSGVGVAELFVAAIMADRDLSLPGSVHYDLAREWAAELDGGQ